MNKKKRARDRQKRSTNAPLKHGRYKLSKKPSRRIQTGSTAGEDNLAAVSHVATYIGKKPKAHDDTHVICQNSTGRVIYEGPAGKLRKQVEAEKKARKRKNGKDSS